MIDEKEEPIIAKDIQVGDIIQILDGQILPADCMILTSNEHRALQRRSTLNKNG